MNNYYVYIYWRLDTNEPFYVGMGHDRRWKNVYKNDRNEHFMRIFNKYPTVCEIIKDNLTEIEAKGIECWLINELVFEYGFSINIDGNRSQEKGNHLCNMTFGGEGTSGYSHTEDWKKNASLSRKGENNGNYGKHWTDEQKERMSIMQKERYKNGCQHPNRGKEMSKEQKEKISKSRMGKYVGRENPNAKGVICITTKMIFFTMKEAGEYYKIKNFSKIGQCCRRERKSCGNYNGKKLVWKYLIWKHNRRYRIDK